MSFHLRILRVPTAVKTGVVRRFPPKMVVLGGLGKSGLKMIWMKREWNGIWLLLTKDMVTEEGTGSSAMLSNVSRRRGITFRFEKRNHDMKIDS